MGIRASCPGNLGVAIRAAVVRDKDRQLGFAIHPGAAHGSGDLSHQRSQGLEQHDKGGPGRLEGRVRTLPFLGLRDQAGLCVCPRVRLWFPCSSFSSFCPGFKGASLSTLDLPPHLSYNLTLGFIFFLQTHPSAKALTQGGEPLALPATCVSQRALKTQGWGPLYPSSLDPNGLGLLWTTYLEDDDKSQTGRQNRPVLLGKLIWVRGPWRLPVILKPAKRERRCSGGEEMEGRGCFSGCNLQGQDSRQAPGTQTWHREGRGEEPMTQSTTPPKKSRSPKKSQCQPRNVLPILSPASPEASSGCSFWRSPGSRRGTQDSGPSWLH